MISSEQKTRSSEASYWVDHKNNPMRESALEFKVGAFVIIGLLLLVALLMNMEVFNFRSGRTLRVMFNYTSGLEVGAPVQLAGVPVGNVQKIDILKDEEGKTVIEVVARVRGDIDISKSAEIRINSKTLLGQKYLEILPGPPGNEPVAGEELLLGHDPVMMEAITNTGDRVVKKLEISVDSLNQLIGDEDFRAKIKDNVGNFNALITDLKDVTGSLKVILARLEKGEGTMGKLLIDESVYEDVKVLMNDLKDHPWKLFRKDDKKKGFALF